MAPPRMARCARRGAGVRSTGRGVDREAPLGATAAPAAAGAADAADAARVSETKRHLVYGLHAVGAIIERAPERLLELWIGEPRDDARARSLTERARAAGVHVQIAGSETLRKLAGE